MMKMTKNRNKGSQRWHQNRRLVLSASNAADIIGFGYYPEHKRSPRQFFASLHEERLKVINQLYKHNKPLVTQTNQDMKRGQVGEELAKQEYERIFQNNITRYGDKTGILNQPLVFSQDLNFIGASPDGKVIFNEEEILLEIKVSKEYTNKRTIIRKILFPSYGPNVLHRSQKMSLDVLHI